ncbi:MAG: hypothetical protein JST12_14780 [Armatimonadetes bacterium]|nr:hypothetical protein [Armatimonadota bacterium]
MFTKTTNASHPFTAPVPGIGDGPVSFRFHLESKEIDHVTPLDGEAFESRTVHLPSEPIPTEWPDIFEPMPDTHFIEACGFVEDGLLSIPADSRFASQLQMMGMGG